MLASILHRLVSLAPSVEKEIKTLQIRTGVSRMRFSLKCTCLSTLLFSFFFFLALNHECMLFQACGQSFCIFQLDLSVDDPGLTATFHMSSWPLRRYLTGWLSAFVMQPHSPLTFNLLCLVSWFQS